ncbi:hypothetical protein BT69DRAFT_1306524 [Atractiella rhizophila]|nr:hypothetical protein BT69DRAFT_1306524 [Atractiella rhizophila]
MPHHFDYSGESWIQFPFIHRSKDKYHSQMKKLVLKNEYRAVMLISTDNWLHLFEHAAEEDTIRNEDHLFDNDRNMVGNNEDEIRDGIGDRRRKRGFSQLSISPGTQSPPRKHDWSSRSVKWGEELVGWLWDSPEPSHPSQLWNRHLNLKTVEGQGRSRLGSPIKPRHNLALSEPPNLPQILASVMTTDLLTFSPVYRRAHDENIDLQTKIRVLRSLHDSFKDYNHTPPPAQPLPHPHESSKSSFSLPEPYQCSSDATAIPRFNQVDFPMITCWTSAEFKAWNDVCKKLGKMRGKERHRTSFRVKTANQSRLSKLSRSGNGLVQPGKGASVRKRRDHRFLGKNYSQIDSTYTNQLLCAFIERFPLLGYCDGYFKALYFLNAASYNRKRSIVQTEKKAQIKTELKDAQPILKNTGCPLK